ncbi:hypothetical protein D3C72_2541470 [compost metagenome]
MPALFSHGHHLLAPHALVADPGMQEHHGQPLAQLPAGKPRPPDVNDERLAYHAQISVSVASLTQQAPSSSDR